MEKSIHIFDDCCSLASFPIYTSVVFSISFLLQMIALHLQTWKLPHNTLSAVQSQCKSIMSVSNIPEREHGLDTLSSDLLWLLLVPWVHFRVLVLTLNGLGVGPCFQSWALLLIPLPTKEKGGESGQGVVCFVLIPLFWNSLSTLFDPGWTWWKRGFQACFFGNHYSRQQLLAFRAGYTSLLASQTRTPLPPIFPSQP